MVKQRSNFAHWGPGVAALALFAAGCSVDSSGPEISSSPVFQEVSSLGGLLLCKVGAAGTTATFSMSATSGVLVKGATFTVPASCDGSADSKVLVWAPSAATDATASITLTEVSSTPGTSLERASFSDLVHIEVFAPATSITVPGIVGRTPTVIFKNIGTPELCLDQNATNYGGALPCLYEEPKCEDVNASNYGGPLPCVYPPPAGCTPGYWKQTQHFDSWPATVATSQLIGTVFTNASLHGLGNYTMLQGLSFKGGSSLTEAAQILLRASIAGLLNSGIGGFFMDTASLVTAVNNALASGDRDGILGLAGLIDVANNAGCILN